jgi:dienelactone hydrolase
MKWLRFLLPAAIAAVVAAAAAPPEPPPVLDAAVRKQLEAAADKLARQIAILRNQNVGDPQLADVEIYHKAAVWALTHNEFPQKDAAEWTQAVLDRGMLRASQLSRGETPWWLQPGQAAVRGYRSRIDGSVQPYAVTLPADYAKEKLKKYRVDVVLHGRNDDLTEVAFLHQHSGDKPAPAEDFVHIDLYGRGENAYRWAGETDLQEAVDNFLGVEQALNRGPLIDRNRFVLRGFSMGGAGTWHLGLHRPSSWCVLGPGAGFTATHGYVKGLPEKLPAFQEDCLTIYDAIDYAENAFNVPVVAYAGAEDDQLKATQAVQDKLAKLDLKLPHPLTLLKAPGIDHKFPPEWEKKAQDEYTKYATPGRGEPPDHVRFVTYTLKYPGCDWVDILALDRHYQRSLVDAERSEKGFTIKTANVRILRLGMLPGATRSPTAVAIDDQKIDARPYQARDNDLSLYLERRDGKWTSVLPEKVITERVRKPQKVAGLTGPIDDAFTTNFLCVRGTGTPWNDAVQTYADADLERFQKEWSKYFRGDLPIKKDEDVTPEDIASKNLILFGDPGSNSLIAQSLTDLPLMWTKDQIAFDGKEFSAKEHVPALIYPSPLAGDRYVVLNSGHTFHADDFKGTNALLYPRLGDFAMLKLGGKKDPLLGVEVIQAGLFDDFWRLPARP